MRVVLIALVTLLAGCNLNLGGSSSLDYVGDTYDSWVIEVDYVAGHRPSAEAMNHMKAQLQPLVYPSITVKVDDEVPGRNGWSVQDMQNYQSKYQDDKTSGKKVVTYMIYADGEFKTEDGGGALGVTVGHDLIAIFDESVSNACTPARLCFFATLDIEKAVVTHEVGHAIGLVNRGLKMVNDHEDDEHPRHSDNPNSVMYWAVDSTLAITGLDRVPMTFDADDKRDICKGGGKGNC